MKVDGIQKACQGDSIYLGRILYSFHRLPNNRDSKSSSNINPHDDILHDQHHHHKRANRSLEDIPPLIGCMVYGQKHVGDTNDDKRHSSQNTLEDLSIISVSFLLQSVREACHTVRLGAESSLCRLQNTIWNPAKQATNTTMTI